MSSEPRTTPEWVTFAAACVVLLTLVGLIAGQLFGDREPADPSATVAGDVDPRGSRFHVPVVVVNDGDATAAEVSVVAELTIGEQVLAAQQTIAFLAGGATEDLVFIFDDDPAGGELVVRVDGFTEP